MRIELKDNAMLIMEIPEIRRSNKSNKILGLEKTFPFHWHFRGGSVGRFIFYYFYFGFHGVVFFITKNVLSVFSFTI